MSKILRIKIHIYVMVPVSRSGPAPWSPRAHSDVVLFVDVLQKLHIYSLVPPLSISKVAKILNQKETKTEFYHVKTF